MQHGGNLHNVCCRFEKQRLEKLNEGIREINIPFSTLDNLVTAINRQAWNGPSPCQILQRFIHGLGKSEPLFVYCSSFQSLVRSPAFSVQVCIFRVAGGADAAILCRPGSQPAMVQVGGLLRRWGAQNRESPLLLPCQDYRILTQLALMLPTIKLGSQEIFILTIWKTSRTEIKTTP